LPSLRYVWVAVLPVPNWPSPKPQAYDAIVPSVSLDPAPKKSQVRPSHDADADATGASFGSSDPGSGMA
jgi:hypothetical protein